MNLVGIGYDVHRLVEGRRLVLGGVEITHTLGLEGHSDADVLLHALADAILGAIGERDIGHHFPNTEQAIRDISSLRIIEKAVQLVGDRDARIINVDATLILEAPRISPHIDAMRENISAALQLPVERVSIKATTNELLGFLGRGEGIAAIAAASVELPGDGRA